MKAYAPAVPSPRRPPENPLSAPPSRSPGTSAATGPLVAGTGIAGATGLIALLDAWAPVVSLGVLYVLPVLLVATRFGVALGVATAVASMLAYNWFLLPPTGEFTIADNRHWAAVGVLLVVAVVSARIAEDGRREARAARAAQREAATAFEALMVAGRERERLAAEAFEAEALRRSDEVKTTLLRSVGHDLRTPLTQIATAAAALRSPSLRSDERAELATGIEAGTERLAAMIEKLLDLSRLEAGAAEPRADRLPLDDLVRDALDGIAADPGRVTLEVEDPVPVVRADAAQVVRILANLIENALIHGGDGPVLIRVAQRRGRAVVRVVDRGVGVPDDQREAIFAPFHRGERGTGSGSGLGLAIARGFAEANGGALRVESYPGQGSAFVLELEPAGADAAGEQPIADGGRTSGEDGR